MRDIEIFLTLAEELHFGRTAQRLHVTPARVSMAIKKQERRIGAILFERTTRRVALTPAGEQLRTQLSAGYQQIMDGIENSVAAARGTSATLTLGTMGPQAWLLGELLESFQREHPAVRVLHRDINPVHPLDLLRSGDIDVGHLWLPVREPDLTVGPVTHACAQVLVVAASHPFAVRASVSREDFGDLTFVAHRSTIPPYMEEVFQPFRTPAGRTIARGPLVSTWDDQLKGVSSGHAVIAAVAESARFYPWPNLVYIPIRDAPQVSWALVWRKGAANPAVAALARFAGAAVTARSRAGSS
ncbi:LysR substrate-binding domain-containing protein [Nocardia neocaledoniensis]|uniref:LysR family transcriptional regulator n=1 Tax=Nocardia neocaledoniensis TaxID=236511 RepID=UPI0033F93BAC